MNYWLNTQKLKDIRDARDLTQADLAELVGVSIGRISHYESGKTKLAEKKSAGSEIHSDSRSKN